MGFRKVDRTGPAKAGPVDLADWDEPGTKKPGPRPRLLSGRRVAVALAALVVSIPMMGGIGGLLAYPRDLRVERAVRGRAAEAKAQGEARLAADLHAEADAIARWNTRARSRGSALVGTLAVAAALAAFGWSRRARHPVDHFAGECLTLATVLFVAFALSVVEFVALFALLMSVAD